MVCAYAAVRTARTSERVRVRAHGRRVRSRGGGGENDGEHVRRAHARNEEPSASDEERVQGKTQRHHLDATTCFL